MFQDDLPDYYLTFEQIKDKARGEVSTVKYDLLDNLSLLRQCSTEPQSRRSTKDNNPEGTDKIFGSRKVLSSISSAIVPYHQNAMNPHEFERVKAAKSLVPAWFAARRTRKEDQDEDAAVLQP